MSDTPLDDRFARFAATGDEALRNELVLEHQGLAIAFARRYARTGSDNDLEQIALEALIHAINRFDPEREVRFSTYAARVIDGRLKQHFRDDGWDIRVPRSIKQLAVAVRSTTSELTNELGRVPSPAELAIEPKGDDHSFLLGQPVEQFGHNEAGVDDIPWLVAGWIAIEFVGSVGVGCVEREGNLIDRDA